MQDRNFQLAQSNSDFLNLLSSVNIPILMLNSDLTIRRITPPAEELLGLTSADVGRPLRQIRLRMDIPELENMILDVMRSTSVRQRQFGYEGSWYRLRVTPYLAAGNKVEGIVAVFLDVTDLQTTPPRRVKHRSRAQ